MRRTGHNIDNFARFNPKYITIRLIGGRFFGVSQSMMPRVQGVCRGLFHWVSGNSGGRNGNQGQDFYYRMRTSIGFDRHGRSG
jgi:hypothetical protein